MTEIEEWHSASKGSNAMRHIFLPVCSVSLAVTHLLHSKEPTTSSITGNIFRPVQLEATKERIAKLKIAEGHQLSVFSSGLGAPRMLATDDKGRVYVTRRGEKGDLLVLEDKDGDGTAEIQRTVLTLPHVHGIAIRDSIIYLATIREVYSAKLDQAGVPGELKLIYEHLPDAGQHPNRTLGFSPDGALFLSVGSAANAAAEPNKESATMLRIDPKGGKRSIFASGLRNTIGFDWHPVTGKFYGMDHGIDYLGDDSQLEELNELKEGANYGWPFVFEDGKANLEDDPEPLTGMSWEEYAKTCEPSVLTATAHSAPMALLFPSGRQFPKDFAGDALVTFHGSWNRSTPSGYKVMRLRFKDGRPDRFEDFLTGFVEGTGQFGRPCGLVELNDGSVLMSDDGAGVIYRISKAEAPNGD